MAIRRKIIAEDKQMSQRRRRLLDLSRHLQEVEVTFALASRVPHRIGEGDEILDLVFSMRRQRQQRNSANPQKCEIEIDEFKSIRQLDYNAIEWDDFEID